MEKIEEFFTSLDRVSLFGPTPEMIKESQYIKEQEKLIIKIKLKPCPFCKSKRLALRTRHHYSGDPFTWSIDCLQCGAKGPSVGELGLQIDAKMKATLLWNQQ